MKKAPIYHSLLLLLALLPTFVFAAVISDPGTQQIQILTNILRVPQSTGNTMSVGQGGQIGPQVAAAKKRAKLMEELAKRDPHAFIGNVIPGALRDKLDPSVRALVEQKVVITGKVDVLHVDDFSQPEKSQFSYHIQSGGKRLSLYSAGSMPAMTSGSLVQVSAYQVGDTAVATGESGSVSIVSAPSPEAVGIQNTLVVLVTGPGQATPPTKDAMKSTIFSGKFNQFYDEQSYGKIHFTGDVTDWISLSGTYPSSCPPNNDAPPQLDLNRSEVRAYLIANNINVANYGRVVFVINGVSSGGCAFVGKLDFVVNGTSYRFSSAWAGMPNPPTMQTGGVSVFEYVLMHEMGHGLGVMHANAWSCSGPSLYTDCYHTEYGNNFDVMGHGTMAKHFNAFYKDALGWLDASSKITITTSGTYALSPIESQGGVRAAIVANPALLAVNPAAAPFYLEYRQPIGFDYTLPMASAGIQINQVVFPETRALPMTRLLNANYASLSAQQALMPGGNFNYSSYGTTIGSPVLTASSATFPVTIQPPVCQRVGLAIADQAPGADSISSRTTVPSDGYGYIQFYILNNDFPGCTSSKISLVASINEVGWAIDQSITSTTFSSLSGTATFVQVSFVPPKATPSGSKNLLVTLTDLTNNRSYQRQWTITVVPPPILNSITPTSAVVESSVSLAGSNFGSLNSVYMSSDSQWTQLPYISSPFPGTTLSFAVPGMMQRSNDGASISTPTGAYTVYLVRRNDGGTSNAIPFNVLLGPTLNLTVNNTSSATISAGQQVTLRWTSLNANSCTASWSPDQKPLNNTLGESFYPQTTTTYTMTCYGINGGITRSVTANIPPTAKLAAAPSPVNYGQSTMISWSSTNARYCSISSNSAQVTNPPQLFYYYSWDGKTTGSQLVGPLIGKLDVTLNCSNDGGSTTTSISVPLIPPTVTLTAIPASVNYGQTTTIAWSSTNASYCSVVTNSSRVTNPIQFLGFAGGPTTGSFLVGPLIGQFNATTTCSGASGTTAKSIAVPLNPPIVTFTASPSSVSYGGSTTVSWSSDASYCSVSSNVFGFSFPGGAASGSKLLLSLTKQVNATITCVGAGGTTARTLIVPVAPPPPTSYL